MATKIIIKTHISGGKCKTTILMAVTKLVGVDEVTIDEEKGTVTVIGDVDATKVVSNLRKAGKPATIESVGPHQIEEPKPKPETPKPKPETPKPDDPLPYCTNGWVPRINHHVVLEEVSPSCSIL